MKHLNLPAGHQPPVTTPPPPAPTFNPRKTLVAGMMARRAAPPLLAAVLALLAVGLVFLLFDAPDADAQAARTVQFSEVNTVLLEDESESVWVTISPPLAAESSVIIRPQAGAAATLGVDYTLHGLTDDNRLVLPAGTTRTGFTVRGTPDMRGEGTNESGVLELVAIANAPYTLGNPGSFEVIILDNSMSAWTATLTPQTFATTSAKQYLGCGDITATSTDKCSDTDTLTSDDFTVGGQSYTVKQVSLLNQTLVLLLDRPILPGLRGYSLHAGETKWDLLDATITQNRAAWGSTGLSWTEDTDVPLRLSLREPPGRPTGVGAAEGSDASSLYVWWTAPESAGDADELAGYDVHYKETNAPDRDPTVSWSATLIAQTLHHSAGFGCYYTGNNPRCGATTTPPILTDNDFSINGVPYTFTEIRGLGSEIFLRTNPLLAEAEWRKYTLSVAGKPVNLNASAGVTFQANGDVAISRSSFDLPAWSSGDRIALSLTKDTDAAAGWVEAQPPPNASALHTVIADLPHGKRYQARVRARTVLGPGPWSATVASRTAIWDAILSPQDILEDGSEFGCDSGSSTSSVKCLSNMGAISGHHGFTLDDLTLVLTRVATSQDGALELEMAASIPAALVGYTLQAGATTTLPLAAATITDDTASWSDLTLEWSGDDAAVPLVLFPSDGPGAPGAAGAAGGDGRLNAWWARPHDTGDADEITGYDLQYKKSAAPDRVATVWSATFDTPDTATSVGHGCDNTNRLFCGATTTPAVLTDNDFDIGNTTYKVTRLVDPGDGTIILGTTPGLMQATVEGYTLWFDGNEINLAAATAGVTVNAQGEIVITKADHNLDSIVADQIRHLRLEPTGGAALGWVEAPQPAAGTTLWAPITGLTNYQSYQVRARARTKVGPGPWSRPGAASPAPQQTVWSARLTAKYSATGPVVGCNNGQSAAEDKCSTAATLTDDDFDVAGTAYVFESILYEGTRDANGITVPASIQLELDKAIPNAFRGYTLHAGDAQIPLASDVGVPCIDSIPNCVKLEVPDGVSWIHNAQVELSLQESLSVPGPPTGLTLAVGDGELTAAWQPPANRGASAITGYDVQYRPTATTTWTDAGHSGTGATQTITGLTNLTEYEARVRAVNAEGAGAWSDTAAATPLPAGTVWAAKLTPQDLATGSGGPNDPTRGLVGCDTANSTSTAKCSAPAALSEASFQFEGATLTVARISMTTARNAAPGTLTLALSGAIPQELRGYALWAQTVGETAQLQFPLAGAVSANAPETATWTNTGLDWAIGRTVQLQLLQGTVPTGVTLETSDGQIDVSWNPPGDPDFTVTGYDVEYKETAAADQAATGREPATGWVDTGHRGSETTQTITGLDNYVKYDVRVRAPDADPDTEDHWSSPATARVVLAGQSTPWEAALTVGSVELGLGCGTPETTSAKAGGVDCSGELTNAGIGALGSNVTVRNVTLRTTGTGSHSGPGTLRFAVDRWFHNYNYLTLVVDGRTFRLVDALDHGCVRCDGRADDFFDSGWNAATGKGFHIFSWPNAGLDWSAGATADLALVYTREAYMGDVTWGYPARKTVRERPPTGVVDAERQGFGQRDGAYQATRDDLDIYRLNVRISEPAGPDGLWGRLTVDPKSTATQGVDYEFINTYGYPIPEERLRVVAEPRFHYPEGEGTSWVHSVFLRIIDDNHEDSGETIIIKPEVPGFMSHGMIITILNHDDGPPPEGEAQPTSLAEAKSAAEKREREQPKRPIPGRSDNANLASLSLPYGGVLRPAFTPDTTEYTVHLSESETRLINLIVKARAAHAGATVTVDGRALQQGLGYLSNPGYRERQSYRVVVTAADAYTTRTYTLTTTTDPVPPPTPPGVTVTPSTLSVSEDGSATYTVALDSRPTADVTITPTSGDDGAVGVSPASHTFTPSGWNSAQTFTVSGLADDDADDESVSVSHAVTSSDAGYDGIAVDNVAVSVADTTPQSPTAAAPIGDATIVNENGTLEVSLTGVFSDADGDPLTIAAASSDETVATVSVAADYSGLTVTARSRGTATITVTADDGNGGTAEDALTVTVKAAPVAARTISHISGLETDDTHSISLVGVFRDADGDALTISAASSDDGKATVSVAADGSKVAVAGVAAGEVTVTVTARDTDGNRVSAAFGVSVVAASAEAKHGEPVGSLRCIARPNQVAFAWTAPQWSGGELYAYDYSLNLPDGRREQTRLRDTTSVNKRGNYPAGKDATIVLKVVYELPDGNQVRSAAASMTCTVADTATVTIIDDDTAGVTVTPSTLSVSEDGSASYTVALDSKPTADVTITPTSGDDGAVGVSPASHTFTPSGWNSAQTFTVSGLADDDADDESVSVSHAVTSSDAGYDGIAVDNVAVSVADTTPEQQQQTAEPEPVEIPGPVLNLQLSGKGKKVIVTWEAPASGGAVDNYIVHLKPDGGGDGKTHRPRAGKTTTTFRNLEPGATYRVWVRAQNEAGKGERVHASVTLPDGVVQGGEGDPPPEQQVARTFSVSVAATAAEGNDAALTITLSEAAPTGGAAFTVTASYGGGSTATADDVGSIASPVTVDEGDTALDISIPIADDDVDEDDETFTVAIAAATAGWEKEGDGKDAATVTITDDDTAGVTVTPTALNISEDGSASYTVVLDSKPTADVTVTPTGSDGGAASVSPASHTFTPSDWNTPQTFTVSGVADEDRDDDSVIISNSATGGDGKYGGISVDDVSVSVTDTTPPPAQEPASASCPEETEPPVPGQKEPFNVCVTPGDGTLTVTWTVAPRDGFEDGEIRHALRWSQEPGVWANPTDPNAVGPNDGISVEGGVYTYTITGLQNGVATGVFVRSFTGGNYNEDSPESSKWVRIKGENTTPRAATTG